MSTTPYAVPEVSTIQYSDAELGANGWRRNEGASAPERTARRKGQRSGETRGVRQSAATEKNVALAGKTPLDRGPT